jgi:hypothetical protein
MQSLETNLNTLESLIKSHFSKLDSLYKSINNTNTNNTNTNINTNQSNSNDTFYIYTTGIANGLDDTLINIWRDCRYKNIINQIPGNFTNIVIHHYDPIIKDYNTSTLYTDVETNSIIDKIKNILNKQDSESNSNSIKTKQTFTKKYFDYSKINRSQPYIILDFAHLFVYCYEKSINDYYIVTQEDYGNNIYNNKIHNLNCIYIPFTYTCDSFWESIKYFEYYTQTNRITSYMELFLKIFDDSFNTQYKTIINRTYLYKKYDDTKHENIIIYHHVDDINDILNKILYYQVYKFIDSNIVVTSTVKTNLKNVLEQEIKTKIFINFFDKLFELPNDNKLLFDINSYSVFRLFLSAKNLL